MSEIISYAQNREDVYINWLLNGKTDGFYVDVGANDPDLDSVTKFFYERNWHGIHIEPIKRHAEALRKLRPRDKVLQLGVSTSAGKLSFREYVDGDGLSTFSTDMKGEYEESQHFIDYEVPVRKLSDVLGDEKVSKIDFLKIDVGGYEYEVIVSNDWKKYRPTLLVIEANHVHTDWRPIVKKEGYELVFFDGLNEYYTCDKSVAERARETYPTFLIGPLILPKRVVDHMNWHEGVVKKQLKNRLTEEKSRLNEALNAVESLRAQLIAERTKPIPKRIRSLMKDILKALKRRTQRFLQPSEVVAYHDTRALNEIARKIDQGLNIPAKEVLDVVHSSDRKNTAKMKKYPLRNLSYKFLTKLYRILTIGLRAGRRFLRKLKG